MELKELLREIHWIEWQLRKFEDRYGVRSEDFFKAMEAGELADFDDMDDPHFRDFMEWHGLCKAWHWRQETYQDLLRRHSLVDQLRTARIPFISTSLQISSINASPLPALTSPSPTCLF